MRNNWGCVALDLRFQMNLTARSNRQSPSDVLKKWGKCGFLIAPLMLTGCQLSIQKPDLSGENQAKFYIQALTRGQEAYYKANGSFAPSPDKLGIDLNLETPDYVYDVVSEEATGRVIMTATARAEDKHSYAGIVTVKPNENGVEAVMNLCQTEQPSPVPPVFPVQSTPGQELDCPPGSVPVN